MKFLDKLSYKQIFSLGGIAVAIGMFVGKFL
jgi:Cu/Ag efflux pump CusA